MAFDIYTYGVIIPALLLFVQVSTTCSQIHFFNIFFISHKGLFDCWGFFVFLCFCSVQKRFVATVVVIWRYVIKVQGKIELN